MVNDLAGYFWGHGTVQFPAKVCRVTVECGLDDGTHLLSALLGKLRVQQQRRSSTAHVGQVLDTWSLDNTEVVCSFHLASQLALLGFWPCGARFLDEEVDGRDCRSTRAVDLRCHLTRKLVVNDL